jgi:hypothetical protein
MPVYELVTRDMLIEWLYDLKVGFTKLLNNPDDDLLCYFILKLYEYIECYARLENLGVDKVQNEKITVKDIKDKINNDKAYSGIVNSFRRLRNSISHGNEKVVDRLINLLSDNTFIGFLHSFKLDNELIDTVEKVSILYKNKNEIYSKCSSLCKQYIIKSKNTNISLEKIRTKLNTKFPKTFVNECLLDALSNQFII